MNILLYIIIILYYHIVILLFINPQHEAQQGLNWETLAPPDPLLPHLGAQDQLFGLPDPHMGPNKPQIETPVDQHRHQNGPSL